MKTEAFFEEIDLLVKSGAYAIPDSDIDIEALHLVGAARKKISRLWVLFVIAIILCMLLVAAVTLFFLLPDFQKKLGFSSSEAMRNQVDARVQIQQLTYEKEELLKSIDTLRKRIEILRLTPPASAETLPESASGETQGQVSPDGIIRHVVERGETLYQLAKKYYGDGLMYPILQQDNKLKVPEDLAEGMTLKIYPEKGRKP